MVIINLTPEQTQLMLNTSEPIYLHDSTGKRLGTVTKSTDVSSITEEEIQEYLRIAKSDGPWYTTAEVLAMLAALEAEGK